MGRFDWLHYETLQTLLLMADDPVKAQIEDAVTQALEMDPK